MTTAEIADYIQDKINSYFANSKETFIDIVSRNIHNELKLVQRPAQVCDAMQKIARLYPSQEVERPNKGKGFTLKLRYYRNQDSFVKINTIVGKPKILTGEGIQISKKIDEIPIIKQEIIEKNIFTFYNEIIKDPNGRFKSWEHCYNFFKEHRKENNEQIINMMSLHLAFYLASWGMLRGSTFLLQKDYLVHLPAIRIMLEDKYEKLWNNEIESIVEQIDLIYECSESIADCYSNQENCNKPSSTLLTKILLGVYGCTPAYDTYFKEGLKKYNISSNYDKRSLSEIFLFYINNKEAFEKCQAMISKRGGDYTPMKLIDMFFWEIGLNLSSKTHENLVIE